jgi:chromosome segregation ATPase
MKAELSVKSRDITSRDSDLRSCSARLHEFERDRADRAQQNADLLSQVAALEGKFAIATAEVQSLREELSIVKAQAGAELARRQDQNERLRKEKEEIRRSIPKEVGALNIELAELRTAVQALKSQNAELTAKQGDSRRLLAEFERLKADVEHAKTLEASWEAAKKENEDLRRRLPR